MRLKSFQASSMNKAMKMAVAELGDDAVIVSSRTLGNGDVRVTAALDDMTADDWEAEQNAASDFYSGAETIADRGALFGGIKDYDQLPDENEIEQKFIEDTNLADQIGNVLLRHGVSGHLSNKIISRAENLGANNLVSGIAHAFQDMFEFEPIPSTPYERPIMLVGQPGVGKTLTVAKLAARAVMNDLKPVVITADTIRAGGVEQLAAFTDVLKLPLLKVNSPEQLKRAIDDHKSADQIIIDCPGLNAFDAQEMKMLNTYIKVAPMDLLLVLAAGGDPEESAELARAFSILGARWMIPTRIDISRRLGGILTAADQAGMGFAAIGNSPDVANGLVDISANYLAKIMTSAMSKRGQQNKKEVEL